MDDELRRWAATWKQMEAFDMGIIRRAKSAYRTEAVRLSLEVGGLGVCAVVLATRSAVLLSRGDISVANGPRMSLVWGGLGLAWSALIIGSVIVRRSWRQRGKSRELLADSPQSLVTDLVRVHERELQTWVSKVGLAFAGFFGAAGLVLGVITAMQAMAAGKSPGALWWTLGFDVLALLALGLFGRRRVGFLRRELRSLRDIQRELGDTERGAS
ncbi:MAG: hypothetical protein ABI895_30780 [Deltaproteobacteria bacterium]